MIIGVTGKSGSGKSCVSKYISSELEYTLLDLDIVSKEIRSEYKKDIVNIVNEDILVNDEIDSKKLGAILFENKELMNKYNELIYEKLKIKISEYKDKNLVVDSMFLPIMSIFDELDFKVLVTCDDKVRMERVIKRDGISKEYFMARDKNSLSYDESLFDICIDNSENNDMDLVWLIDKIKTHACFNTKK